MSVLGLPQEVERIALLQEALAAFFEGFCDIPSQEEVAVALKVRTGAVTLSPH
jgi:hypothetical protein